MGALFSPEAAKNLSQAAVDRKESLSGPPRLRNQVILGKLIKVEHGLTSDKSKTPGRAKVMLTYQDIKEEYAPVVEELVIEGEEDWIETKRKQLVERVVMGFKAQFKAAKDAQQLVENLNAFLQKPLKIAIQLEQRIWKRIKTLADGSQVEDWVPVEDPRVWYVGPHDEEMYYNEAKSIIMLKEGPAAEWSEYKQRHPENKLEFGKRSHAENAHTAAATSIPPAQAKAPAPSEAKNAVAASGLDLPDMGAPAPAATPKPAATAGDLPDLGAVTQPAAPAQQAAAANATEDPLGFLSGPGN